MNKLHAFYNEVSALSFPRQLEYFMKFRSALADYNFDG